MAESLAKGLPAGRWQRRGYCYIPAGECASLVFCLLLMPRSLCPHLPFPFPTSQWPPYPQPSDWWVWEQALSMCDRLHPSPPPSLQRVLPGLGKGVGLELLALPGPGQLCQWAEQ